MKKIGVIVCIVLMVFALAACSGETWQEHYDLGMRYIEEGNYEEAIIAFNKAIEIDPKQPQVYTALADVYIELEEYEQAQAILEEGYEQTDDTSLIEKIDTLPVVNLSKYLDQTNALSYADLPELFFATPEELLGYFPQANFMEKDKTTTDSTGYTYYFKDGFRRVDELVTVEGEKLQIYDPGIIIAFATYSSQLESAFVSEGIESVSPIGSIGWKDIHTNDAYGDVLTKLGLSENANDFSEIEIILFENNDQMVKPDIIGYKNDRKKSILVNFIGIENRYCVHLEFQDDKLSYAWYSNYYKN